MTDKATFDLEADPFNTGFEVNPKITTDMVLQWIEDRDSFMPNDREKFNDVLWYKACAKAAIKNGWFTSPSWKPNDVGEWPLGQTFWLGRWTIRKYSAMQEMPPN